MCPIVMANFNTVSRYVKQDFLFTPDFLEPKYGEFPRVEERLGAVGRGWSRWPPSCMDPSAPA